MKLLTYALAIITSLIIGYLIASLKADLDANHRSEKIISVEIALLEKYKSEIPCQLLTHADKQMITENKGKAVVIWLEGKDNNNQIRKLVIDEKLNIAEESLTNYCKNISIEP